MMKFRLTTNRAVFVVGAVLATLYGGAKHATGRISYPRTDPETWYLMDNGSYVTNDAVHVAFLRNPILPDEANFFIEGLELSYTNDSDWAEHSFLAYSNTLGSAVSPFDLPWSAATNYNWIAYTDWVPPPTTHTNGVAYAAWQRPIDGATNKVVTYKTGIYIDARRIAPNVVRLPYDAEVEYLESTGTQYINSGVMSEYPKIHAGLWYDRYRTAYTRFFGNYGDEQHNCIRLILQSSANDRAWVTPGTKAGGSINVPFAKSEWHNVYLDCTAKSCTIDGELFTTPNVGTRYVDNICIFADPRGPSANAVIRISFFKIWNDNGVLVRDLIPVRVGTTGAMYDKRGVGGMNGNGTARNDGLYFNRGTGDFGYGNDIAE